MDPPETEPCRPSAPPVKESVDLVFYHGGSFEYDDDCNIIYEGGEQEFFPDVPIHSLSLKKIIELGELGDVRYGSKIIRLAYWDSYYEDLTTGIEPLEKESHEKHLQQLCYDGMKVVNIYFSHEGGPETPVLATAEEASALLYEHEEAARMEAAQKEAAQKEAVQKEAAQKEATQKEAEPIDVEVSHSESSVKKNTRRKSSAKKRTQFPSYKKNGRFKESTVEERQEMFREAEARVIHDLTDDGYEGDEGHDSVPVTAAEIVGEVEDESEEFTTEEERSKADSGSSKSEREHFNYPEYTSAESQNPVILVGMEFKDLEEFKSVMRDMNICQGREVRLTKNDKSRVRAVCYDKEGGCPWLIYCSFNSISHNFQVKTFEDKHTCHRRASSRLATREWVAQKLVHLVRCEPLSNSTRAFNWIVHKHKIRLNDAMSFRALQTARTICEGEEKKQYAVLRDYGGHLLTTNPQSTVYIQSGGENNVFERMYVCLKACKEWFKAGCMPLIVLDGCFLKGYFGGQLLAAVSQDGNNSFFVIAYVVVDVENRDNWAWFLRNLIEDLQDGPHDRGFTFISDRQKGLDLALGAVCPQDPHRYCARHIWANFNKVWKGLDFKKAFWGCAKATTPQQFDEAMSVMRRLSREAAEWLERIPVERWSRSGFDSQCKNMALTSNMCEQFNKEILNFRGKPIISLLEGVRKYINGKMVKSRARLERHRGTICPKVKKKLEELQIKASSWTPHWCGDSEQNVYEATNSPWSACAVNLGLRTCSCRVWDIFGIPCVHAIACMGINNRRPEEYISEFLTKEKSLAIYAPYINPVPGEKYWPKVNLPPVAANNFKRKAGRPKKQRRKAPEEEECNTVVREPGGPQKVRRRCAPPKCKACGQQGHNVRSCRKHRVPYDPDGENDAAVEAELFEEVQRQADEELKEFPSSPAAPEVSQPSQVSSDANLYEHPVMVTVGGSTAGASFIPTSGPTMMNPLGGRAYRPPPMRNLFGAPMSKETMQGASAGTAKRFASFVRPSSRSSKKNH